VNTERIQVRYSELAEETCCLSCGSAIEYSEVKPGEVCVDLGSGRGTDVIRMAEATGKDGMAIGIDVSEGMLLKAKKSAAKLGVENTAFIRSELENIELGSGLVDLVISNCTINHVGDKQQVWREIKRILKPGGRFVVSDIFATTEVPDQYRNDPQAVAECWAGATTKEEYLQTVRNVGFKDIRIIEESAPYPKGEIEIVSFTIAGRKPCCE
jgi:arsenite methyltransferase